MLKKNELKFIEITKNTRLKGNAVSVGDVLSVGDDGDISFRDSIYLIGIQKAMPSEGKKRKTRKPKSEKTDDKVDVNGGDENLDIFKDESNT